MKGATLRRRNGAEVEQGRHQIDIGRERGDLPALSHPAVWPAHQPGNAVAALIDTALEPAHAGVERARLRPGGDAALAVVAHEHQDGVVLETERHQVLAQPAEILVDIADHAEEAGVVLGLGQAFIAGLVARFDIVRMMWRIGADKAEEGLARVRFDEVLRLAEKDVGAIARKRGRDAVHQIGVVEIVVAPPVGALADPATAVTDRGLKSAVLRAIRVFVAQVPFAEQACAVARLAEGVGQGPLVLAQQRAPADRVPDACGIAVMAGQQPSARRRAGGARVELPEPHRLAVETVEMRRLDERMAVRAQRRIALVVGQDQDHVRAAG